MFDFMTISTRIPKRGVIEVYPKFLVKKSSDLMIRGSDFYAIWVEERKLWSTEEVDALQLIDRELDEYTRTHVEFFEGEVRIMYMRDSDSGSIDRFHKYCQKQMRDNFHMLDEKLIFSNTETEKTDYASKRLPYPLEKCDIPSYEKLMSTLYSSEERRKIEWAIGSIVAGDSKKIQKFLVLYGAAGTGKSTVLNIIQQLFEGYYSVFDAKALGSSSNAFALEAFKTNPLVAIQHDGDLSHIEDNTRLNSLVSHELMTVNEKFKSSYSNQFKSFLFMGTNKPVRITDGKSGLIRRLIDVSPSGNKLSSSDYKTVIGRIKHELGGIASHCLDIYMENPGYYDNYIPVTMLGASNDFYNFVADSYYIFTKDDGVSLTSAWELYKLYCEDAKVPYPMSRRAFQEELKNYFQDYQERITTPEGNRIRSWYSGFKIEKFEDFRENEKPPDTVPKIVFEEASVIGSAFDILCASCIAQFADDEKGTPFRKWSDVVTKLSEIQTSKLHYVRVPENHIVIDFDIPGKDGEKDFEANLREASKWPPTYAELSKSGAGIHLHYIYTGDPKQLSRIIDEHIEVKVFTGNSSLRRKLTKCNRLPIAEISSGLPLKGEKMIDSKVVTTERGIRTLIKRNLEKEYHSSTICSIQFISQILNDAYEEGVHYDVSDMRNAVYAFAAHSTHQADNCLRIVDKMPFKSKEPSENVSTPTNDGLIFYDVEVFPNLFVICWKLEGEGNPVVKLINPGPTIIEDLIQHKLVGFNCRKYDNHILHAALMGYSPKELYGLSQKIIEFKTGFFGEAYNISFTDIYDFSSKKQSLKKFEIELGIHHQELGLPWDEEVPENLWETVADYCVNDVIATEAVFNARKGDWTARQILAELSGLTPNDTSNSHTTRIIFGTNKKPQLVYTDLSEMFPDYQYVPGPEHKGRGKNIYKGEDVGFGGYVYASPGMYFGKIKTYDVASMHPSSIIALNLFGEYTQRFKDILDVRISIKHKDFEKAKSMLDGKLAPYLDDESQAKALAGALKIVINSVYGLTSAQFDNPFRDPRNVNNIVALRGALTMRDLLDEVENRGFHVVHVKTDSIKIVNPSPELEQFVLDFGHEHGYNFEVEHVFERICLVNDAVYIAKLAEDDPEEPGQWTATGDQFQVPYVFKTLFTKEEIQFEDVCEVKTVATSLYLDFNEGKKDVSEEERVASLRRKIAKYSEAGTGETQPKLTGREQELLNQWIDISDEQLSGMIAEGHNYQFVGKVGNFCPIKEDCGGALLLRDTGKKDAFGKIFTSAEGSSGYRWMEAEIVRNLECMEYIDYGYYRELVDKAVQTVSEFGDFEFFTADDISINTLNVAPWFAPEDEGTCAFDVR